MEFSRVDRAGDPPELGTIANDRSRGPHLRKAERRKEVEKFKEKRLRSWWRGGDREQIRGAAAGHFGDFRRHAQSNSGCGHEAFGERDGGSGGILHEENAEK